MSDTAPAASAEAVGQSKPAPGAFDECGLGRPRWRARRYSVARGREMQGPPGAVRPRCACGSGGDRLGDLHLWCLSGVASVPRLGGRSPAAAAAVRYGSRPVNRSRCINARPGGDGRRTGGPATKAEAPAEVRRAWSAPTPGGAAVCSGPCWSRRVDGSPDCGGVVRSRADGHTGRAGASGDPAADYSRCAVSGQFWRARRAVAVPAGR